MDIILGNILTLFATVSDAVSGTRKTTKSILSVQIVSQLFYGAAGIALKGYSATVQNAVSILRNIVAIWGKSSKVIEWILVILGVGLGIAFNNLGLLGWLPIVANLVYSLAVFRSKDNERMLKAAFCFAVFCFTVFNAMLYNVVGAIANGALLVSNLIFLIRDIRAKNNPS